MVEILPRKDIPEYPSIRDLLYDDEIVVIVDDSPEIVLLLETYLSRQHIPVAKASNAEELDRILAREKIALILLDIGLPGKSGREILRDLVPNNPDLGVIMVTGTTDIQTALECLRQGADDYLTKPIVPKDFLHTLTLTLKKRRLAIENRIFQRELEVTNFRMQFLHNLNLKMNTAYLNALELDSVLQTILAGITSEDGLKFNRAFLALFDNDGEMLCGKLAIGPSSREEASQVWQAIKVNNLGLQSILNGILENGMQKDAEVNRIAMSLKVPSSEKDHILISSSLERKSILVRNGIAEQARVPQDLLDLLKEKNFIVVPLFSASRSLGVIIADNFVTGAEISHDDVIALEIFANQASLAIEHSHLYRDMHEKITELEMVTEELEKNKDMLIEAERYSTIGYISAQLVHAIRNPLTSIGVTARLLQKRAHEESAHKYLRILTEETLKIEETLKNLFQFVEDVALEKEHVSLTKILRESLAVFYATLKKKEIGLELHLPEDDVFLEIDARKMRKVFMHLIRNSIDAMEFGGLLSVELVQNEEFTAIDITDTGTGIGEAGSKLVSTPFYTTKTYGTGLGLTLVEQILELHGAQFHLRQRHPQGTRASIRFPLQKFTVAAG